MTLVLATTAPAFAQSDADVNARMRRLENEMQTLSRAVFKGEAPPPGLFDANTEDTAALARTENRFSQLEEEIRYLTGRVEEQGYEVRRLKENLDQALQKIESLQAAQIRQQSTVQPTNNAAAVMTGAMPVEPMEDTTATPTDNGDLQAGDLVMPNVSGDVRDDGVVSRQVLEADDTATPAINVIPDSSKSMGQLNVETGEAGEGAAYAAVSNGDSPAAEYEEAFALLKNNDYASAQAAFETFLEQYPDHVLAANAIYWLGETFYVRNEFQQAARVFAQAYQKYPDGPKGPDNLLKLALSLAGTGDTDNACLTLVQLDREYPSGTSPVLNRAQQEKQKLGCK